MVHLTLASGVSDFEECKELGWNTAPEHTKQLSSSSPHPNSIIATHVVAKVESHVHHE